MAERRGLAPRPRKIAIDLFSKQSQPVVWLTLLGALGQIRTDAARILSPLPLLLGYESKMVPREGVAPSTFPF